MCQCSKLSKKQKTILKLIGAGHRPRTIAASLGLSHRTVEGHLARLRQKLGLHNKVELMLYARECAPGRTAFLDGSVVVNGQRRLSA